MSISRGPLCGECEFTLSRHMEPFRPPCIRYPLRLPQSLIFLLFEKRGLKSFRYSCRYCIPLPLRYYPEKHNGVPSLSVSQLSRHDVVRFPKLLTVSKLVAAEFRSFDLMNRSHN